MIREHFPYTYKIGPVALSVLSEYSSIPIPEKKKDFYKYIKKEGTLWASSSATHVTYKPNSWPCSSTNKCLCSLVVKSEVRILMGVSDLNVVSILCQINYFKLSQRPKKINNY